MKKINIFGLLFAILFMAGCDYNDDNFGDLTPKIPDAAAYDGPYTGKYPSTGYFSDKTVLASSVNTMLKGMYTYCDAGSIAKVSIQYGDITLGFAAPDAKYVLSDDDYLAMGTGTDQPGEYKNFSAKMDVDSYLKTFCASKYASLADGKTVAITYKFYYSGSNIPLQTNTYKKESGNWNPVQLPTYTSGINYTLVGSDANYTLQDADYIAMGAEAGEPGKYKNFDSTMDVDRYLTDFCTKKYASSTTGYIACITYKFRGAGAIQVEQFSYVKKMPTYWTVINYESDYKAMGTDGGKPGKYDNFDANMDIDQYLTAFLKLKYPYTAEGTTAEVTYKYYASSVTSMPSRIYKYDGASWAVFDPSADVVAVSTKIAEMSYDGTTWKLERLLGGTQRITMTKVEFGYIVEWVTKNKPAGYLKNADNEFYFGASGSYGNFSQSNTDWTANDPEGLYAAAGNGKQAFMDQRILMAISEVLLPKLLPTPDPGLSYEVYYNIFSGASPGDYMTSFMYNEEKKIFEKTNGPIKQ